MIQINLLPDVKRELLRSRSTRNFVTSLSVLIGIISLSVVAILVVFLGGQFAASVFQDNVVKDKSNQLLAVDDLAKSVTIQSQLKTINDQHGSKQINSRLFDVIKAVNPPAPNNVKISSIKLDPSAKTVILEGSAGNGYVALEVLKKTITSTEIHVKQGDDDVKKSLTNDVQAGSTSFGEDAEGKRVLRFSFTFTYPDELFASSDHIVSIVTPTTKVDVTDSKLGVPESLFSKKAEDSSARGESVNGKQ